MTGSLSAAEDEELESQRPYDARSVSNRRRALPGSSPRHPHRAAVNRDALQMMLFCLTPTELWVISGLAAEPAVTATLRRNAARTDEPPVPREWSGGRTPPATRGPVRLFEERAGLEPAGALPDPCALAGRCCSH